MARRRRGKDSSILDEALQQGWQFSAALAGFGLIITAIVIPLTIGTNKLVAPIGKMFQMFGWAATGVFALIAVVKYVRQRDSTARPGTSREIRQEPSVSGWTAAAANRSSTGTALNDAWNETFAKPTQNDVQARPTAWSLPLLRQIEWKRFEELIAAYFREIGYRVESIRCGADGGVDAKIFHGDNLIAIAQCKAWNSRPVGVKPVRELLGVMAHQKVGKGLFMATGQFTNEAVAFANENPLTLVTGEELMSKIQSMSGEMQQRLLAGRPRGNSGLRPARRAASRWWNGKAVEADSGAAATTRNAGRSFSLQQREEKSAPFNLIQAEFFPWQHEGSSGGHRQPVQPPGGGCLSGSGNLSYPGRGRRRFGKADQGWAGVSAVLLSAFADVPRTVVRFFCIKSPGKAVITCCKFGKSRS